MKITFVNRGMGMYRGGGEMFDLNMAAALRASGEEVGFVVGSPLLGPPPHPVDGFPVTYCRTPYLRGISQRLPLGGGRLMHLDLDLFAAKARRAVEVNGTADIVQACAIASLAPILHEGGERRDRGAVPVVVRYPGPPSERDRERLAACAAVIANGDALVQIRARFRTDAVDIPPGIDHARFRRVDGSALRAGLGLQDRPVVLFVGRLVPLKNLPFLIRVFAALRANLPNARLVLVGEGPSEAEARHEAKRARVSEAVMFARAVPQAELPRWYSLADVFVMPSTYDNFPNAVLEAMACECAVVATRVGGIPLQIEDGRTGVLVESGDTAACAGKILELVNDRPRAREMGARARQTVVGRYDWAKSASALREVYRAVLARG